MPDAFSRTPPRPGQHRHRVRRADQRTPQRGGLHCRAFGRALVRLHGRLRRRVAVSVSDGRTRAPDRSAQVPAPPNRHAPADAGPWRLFRLRVFGARSRRLSDVWRHAGADLRSRTAAGLSEGDDGVLSPWRHRQVARDHARRVRARLRRRRGRPVCPPPPAGAVFIAALSGRPRRLQRRPDRQPAQPRSISMSAARPPEGAHTAGEGVPVGIEVIEPGLATTVQDLGRPGYYHLGIPQSGALDQYALRLANLLVANDETAAALECTLLAPRLQFRQDAIIAVTGAELDVRIAGQPVARHAAHLIEAGQQLSFGFMKSGARAYIAVAGGIAVPVVLGSRSTYGLGAFGGFAGRKLQAGDILPLGMAARPAAIGRVAPPEVAVATPKAPSAIFFDDCCSVAPEANRTGYRSRGGRALAFEPRVQPFGAGSDPSNIVDAGYPYGSIQVPGGSEPIILHRDAVSGGGYAMIGTVISADMDRIAQMQPHHKARFIRVDMEQALAARAAYRERLHRLRSALTT